MRKPLILLTSTFMAFLLAVLNPTSAAAAAPITKEEETIIGEIVEPTKDDFSKHTTVNIEPTSTGGVLHWTPDLKLVNAVTVSPSHDEVRERELAEQKTHIKRRQEVIQEILSENYHLNPQNNAKVVDFIKTIGVQAHGEVYELGLYPSVLIAQAIIESAAGQSGLSAPPNYNLFGIKGSYNGSCVEMWTFEDDGSGNTYEIVAAFRKYPSYSESIQDYGQLLRHGLNGLYAPTWRENTTSYLDATSYLQGTYATATNYADALNSTIAQYNLTRFDEEILSEYMLAWIESDSYSVEDFTDVIQEVAPDEYEMSFDSIPVEFIEFMPIKTDMPTSNMTYSNPYSPGSSIWFIHRRTHESGRDMEGLPENIDNWDFESEDLLNREIDDPEIGAIAVDVELERFVYIEAVHSNGDVLISESGKDLPVNGVYKIISADKISNCFIFKP